MAKPKAATNKSENPKNSSKNKVAKAEQPIKNVQKASSRVPVKPKKAQANTLSVSMATMVINAFENIKVRGGIPLAAIRNYISDIYKVEMTKSRQTKIKKFIQNEFLEGRIKMTNHDGDVINYTKRFRMIPAKAK